MNTDILISTNEVDTISEMLKYDGQYGNYGGSYITESLAEPLNKVAEAFDKLASNEQFNNEYIYLLKQFVGRPSPLYFARRLSEFVGSRMYLKREDLNHTGSHKINNAIGQVLIAQKLKSTEIIAETGAGQHGVATATAAAFLGVKCKIFMGLKDAERQALNVKRIEMLGAEVITIQRGSATLKDAVDAALEYYISHPQSYYLLGSQVGPNPYPRMVGYFQSVIGHEAHQQILKHEGHLPQAVFACVGGGSNAIGLFSGFLNDSQVALFGAEAGGLALPNNTAATLTFGKPSIFQGTYSYCLVDDDGNPVESKSIAAGLDYPGISPQHAYLHDTKRATYHPITDHEAIVAMRQLANLEGIIPAIESAHAVALAIKTMKNKAGLAIVNISGRGDKDLERDL